MSTWRTYTFVNRWILAEASGIVLWCGDHCAQDFERIRQENLRVRSVDFARLRLAAEKRADALEREGQGDWYLAGGYWADCRYLPRPAGLTPARTMATNALAGYL